MVAIAGEQKRISILNLPLQDQKPPCLPFFATLVYAGMHVGLRHESCTRPVRSSIAACKNTVKVTCAAIAVLLASLR